MIGASVIGMEYASIFSALDIKVTVLEPTDRCCQFVDRELVDEFMHDLRDRGVSLRFGCQVKAIDAGADGRCVTDTEDGRQVRQRHGAVRRRPRRAPPTR